MLSDGLFMQETRFLTLLHHGGDYSPQIHRCVAMKEYLLLLGLVSQ